jgi:hypothetical protein
MDLHSPRTEDLLRALQNECARTNTHLVMYTVSPRDGRIHTLIGGGGPLRIPVHPSSWQSYFGFLIWRTGIRDSDLWDIVRRLSIFKKPIAILDETGDARVPVTIGGRGRIAIYKVGCTATPGEEMGKHLLRLGHRRVAYISPVHATLWSQRLLAGLAGAFEAAGIEGGVMPCTLERLRVEEQQSGRVTARETVDLLLRSGGGGWARNRVARSRAAGRLRFHVSAALNRLALHRTLVPLLEKALSDSAVTVWVTTGAAALECLDFLEERGKRVPQDISVAAFDDTVEASLEKLTSYNFNPPAVVHSMLGHVMQSRAQRGVPREPKTVEIQGFVNRRRTAAPPGKRNW